MVLRRARLLMPVVWLVLLAAGLTGSAAAQRAGSADGQTRQTGLDGAEARSGPTSAAEVETFLDGLIAEQLEHYAIPGAVVAVVKDDEILFARGYGIADASADHEVSAERTLFPIGSMSALFTWSAVMQLVEAGTLDLHADVNTYLSEPIIPATFPEPVTLAHLLTHTAGFEDRLSNLFSFRQEELIPLETFITEERPRRVYPPGEVVAYSNYGAALAGYIVQDVSGQAYEEYIAEHILEPLAMEQTSAQQPLPASLVEDLAQGHVEGTSGELYLLDEYSRATPASGVSTTATDLAHFLIAHLQDGRYRSHRLMEPETARTMHEQHYTSDQRIAGLTYGFMEWDRNNQHILWYPGATATFMSLCMLLPEHDTGVFVAYNSSDGNQARWDFREAFLDHYYPVPEPTELQPADHALEQANHFTGSYRQGRWNYHTVDRLIYALSRMEQVQATSDGTLLFKGSEWVEVSPLVFRERNGPATLVFHQDEQGRIAQAFYDVEPYETYLKLRWYESPALHGAVAAGCLLVFLSAMVGLPAAVLIDWRRGNISEMERMPTIARWLIAAISALYITFPLAVGLSTLSMITNNPLEVMTRYHRILDVPLRMPQAAGILTIGSLYFLVLAWREKYWNRWARWHYALVVVTSLLFLGLLNYWNLIGHRFS